MNNICHNKNIFFQRAQSYLTFYTLVGTQLKLPLIINIRTQQNMMRVSDSQIDIGMIMARVSCRKNSIFINNNNIIRHFLFTDFMVIIQWSIEIRTIGRIVRI